MPPEQMQQNMNGDQSAAALSFATMLQEQMMPNVEQPMEATEAPVDAETAPEQPEETQDMGSKMADMEKSMSEKLDQIRKELKEDNQREMDALKKTIQDALKD